MQSFFYYNVSLMTRHLEDEGHILTSFSYLALPDTRQREPLILEQFRPFISLKGLDSETSTSFLNFLQELFQKTPKHLWSRESCCGAVEIARTARTISSDYFTEQTKINVLMGLDHFWSVVEQPSQTKIIVDPAGIWDPEFEAVLPYFGVLEECSFEGDPLMYAKQVYGGGKVLTLGQEEILLRHQGILLYGI
jgi:hypothetical protein